MMNGSVSPNGGKGTALQLHTDHKDTHALYAALDSFRQYRQAAHYNITHLRRLSFYSLPSAHVDILCEPPFSLPQNFDAVDTAIDSNADIAEAILEAGLSTFSERINGVAWQGTAEASDVDKARSTIRQLYRDWSLEGLTERHASHAAIVTALADHLPGLQSAKILVPGAGLGRLVYELGLKGNIVEGNEVSYHQLLAYDYVCRSSRQHLLFPWALSFNNHLSRGNQLQSVKVPDIYPNAAIGSVQTNDSLIGRTSMTAGNFCNVYQKPAYSSVFDAVTTCFFIDTGPNFLRYIETVKHTLRSGGLWINLGPLLWHFEAMPTPSEKERHASTHVEPKPSAATTIWRDDDTVESGSFELSSDEVIALIERFGFEVLEQGQAPAGATGYIQDQRSMLQNVYMPAFWVARKR